MLEQPNYFSLLIPLFLIAVVLCLVSLSRFCKVPQYILWLTAAITLSVFVQVIQTILSPTDIYTWALITCLLFFISMACTIHAVHLRLKIKTHWLSIFVVIVLAELCIAYFSFIQPKLSIRLAIVAITSCLILLNQPLTFFRLKPNLTSDKLLKFTIYGIIFSITARATLLILFHNQHSWVTHHQTIWALTQFIILFFIIILVVLLISTSIGDTIQDLYEERNLDPLTQTLNRRALTEQLPRFYQSHLYHQHAILMCDLDHFKKINDEYGHDAGDQILKHVAQLMKTYIRTTDCLARIGGEEFQIILYDIPHQKALEIAEQLRLRIAQKPFYYHEHQIILSISIGLSYFHQAENYAQAVQAADQLLYQAKHQGRNNVQWQHSALNT